MRVTEVGIVKGSALVIAVDGPSGSGKSSVARAVAERLGLRYLDTGAMYRAVTLWMLRSGVDVTDSGVVAAVVKKPSIQPGTDPVAPTVRVDGVDVSGDIRTDEVTSAVSAVSAVPEVRQRLVAAQRELIGAGGIAVEGRDIGTVVAPCAPVKVFLTASAEERAQRRTRDLAALGSHADSGDRVRRSTAPTTVDTTRADLARRDRLDSSRVASPMARAEDAVEIDSTALRFDEVVEAVLRVVRERAEAGEP